MKQDFLNRTRCYIAKKGGTEIRVALLSFQIRSTDYSSSVSVYSFRSFSCTSDGTCSYDANFIV